MLVFPNSHNKCVKKQIWTLFQFGNQCISFRLFMGNKYGKITKKIQCSEKKQKKSRNKTDEGVHSQFLFIHLTFGVWANREELFLLKEHLKRAQNNFPHLDSMSISIYFNRRKHPGFPDLGRKKIKPPEPKTKKVPTHPD